VVSGSGNLPPPCVTLLPYMIFQTVRGALAVLKPQAISVSNAVNSFYDDRKSSAEAGTCLQYAIRLSRRWQVISMKHFGGKITGKCRSGNWQLSNAGWQKCRPVTSLGHQEGRRVFWEGPKIFKLCPIVSNYIQHVFPGGRTFFLGCFAPPGYGPAESRRKSGQRIWVRWSDMFGF